jgi:small subunit ribosomal protein S13
MALTLFGLSLPPHALLAQALPRLYGLGPSRSVELCRTLGLAPAVRVRDLTPDQQDRLTTYLKATYIVAGSLEEQERLDRQRLTSNGCRRGIRLSSGLPVRGQRTHSNGQTAKRRRFR